MKKKEKVGCLFGLVGLFVSMPLAAVASYLLLQHVGATDVMWMLFWINWPLSLVLNISMKIAENLVAND